MIYLFSTITVAASALLFSYSSTQAIALPQQKNTPVTVAQAKAVTDTSIIPGKKVGPITSKTTRRDLVRIFGASNLKDTEEDRGEGARTFAVTKVNLGRSGSLTVLWEDNARNKVSYVEVQALGWKTPDGVGVGTSLNDLRRILGEFKINGLGWGLGNRVYDLQMKKLPRYYENLSLMVDADEKLAQKFPKQYQAVLGEQQLPASHPNWKPLGIKVTSLDVFFGS
jgi:hypothetical protein